MSSCSFPKFTKMCYKSPVKLLRSIKRITQFMEKKTWISPHLPKWMQKNTSHCMCIIQLMSPSKVMYHNPNPNKLPKRISLQGRNSLNCGKFQERLILTSLNFNLLSGPTLQEFENPFSVVLTPPSYIRWFSANIKYNLY